MSDLFKCTYVKQLPNYCVPACLESIAIDIGVPITQAEIVKKYPEVFPKGELNDINKPKDLVTVIKELGLCDKSDEVIDVHFELNGLINIIKDNHVLLFWTKLSNHCVRLCGFSEDLKKVYFMNPENDKECSKDVEWLNDINPDILFFKRKD